MMDSNIDSNIIIGSYLNVIATIVIVTCLVSVIPVFLNSTYIEHHADLSRYLLSTFDNDYTLSIDLCIVAIASFTACIAISIGFLYDTLMNMIRYHTNNIAQLNDFFERCILLCSTCGIGIMFFVCLRYFSVGVVTVVYLVCVYVNQFIRLAALVLVAYKYIPTIMGEDRAAKLVFCGSAYTVINALALCIPNDTYTPLTVMLTIISLVCLLATHVYICIVLYILFHALKYKYTCVTYYSLNSILHTLTENEMVISIYMCAYIAVTSVDVVLVLRNISFGLSTDTTMWYVESVPSVIAKNICAILYILITAHFPTTLTRTNSSRLRRDIVIKHYYRKMLFVELVKAMSLAASGIKYIVSERIYFDYHVKNRVILELDKNEESRRDRGFALGRTTGGKVVQISSDASKVIYTIDSEVQSGSDKCNVFEAAIARNMSNSETLDRAKSPSKAKMAKKPFIHYPVNYINSNKYMEILNKCDDASGLLYTMLHDSVQLINCSDYVEIGTFLRTVLYNDFERGISKRIAFSLLEQDMSVIGGMYIQVDRLKFANILRNISDNALRFTNPGGSISVTANIIDASNASGVNFKQPMLMIVFRDSGIGIDEAHIDRIFKQPIQIVNDCIVAGFEGSDVDSAVDFNLISNDELGHSGSIAAVHADRARGYSLYLASILIKKFGGAISIISEGLGLGCTVQVYVPISMKLTQSVRSGGMSNLGSALAVHKREKEFTLSKSHSYGTLLPAAYPSGALLARTGSNSSIKSSGTGGSYRESKKRAYQVHPETILRNPDGSFRGLADGSARQGSFKGIRTSPPNNDNVQHKKANLGLGGGRHSLSVIPTTKLLPSGNKGGDAPAVRSIMAMLYPSFRAGLEVLMGSSRPQDSYQVDQEVRATNEGGSVSMSGSPPVVQSYEYDESVQSSYSETREYIPGSFIKGKGVDMSRLDPLSNYGFDTEHLAGDAHNNPPQRPGLTLGSLGRSITQTFAGHGNSFAAASDKTYSYIGGQMNMNSARSNIDRAPIINSARSSVAGESYRLRGGGLPIDPVTLMHRIQRLAGGSNKGDCNSYSQSPAISLASSTNNSQRQPRYAGSVKAGAERFLAGDGDCYFTPSGARSPNYSISQAAGALLFEYGLGTMNECGTGNSSPRESVFPAGVNNDGTLATYKSRAGSMLLHPDIEGPMIDVLQFRADQQIPFASNSGALDGVAHQRQLSFTSQVGSGEDQDSTNTSEKSPNDDALSGGRSLSNSIRVGHMQTVPSELVHRSPAPTYIPPLNIRGHSPNNAGGGTVNDPYINSSNGANTGNTRVSVISNHSTQNSATGIAGGELYRSDPARSGREAGKERTRNRDGALRFENSVSVHSRSHSRSRSGTTNSSSIPFGVMNAFNARNEHLLTKDGRRVKSLHLLIVDDSEMHRKVLCQIVTLLGHTYEEASDGADCVELVRRRMGVEVAEGESRFGAGGIHRPLFPASRASVAPQSSQLATEGAGSHHSVHSNYSNFSQMPDKRFEREKWQFDVILLDEYMPRLDGLDSLNAVQGLGYQGIIIGLSTFVHAHTHEMIVQGCSSVCVKPIQVDVLKNVIDQCQKMK